MVTVPVHKVTIIENVAFAFTTPYKVFFSSGAHSTLILQSMCS